MWSYLIRRLLLMIPTLFGITVVTFCIMQLAPGDPMLVSLGAGGAAGESSQTRDAYLIQKRDLKLDKPLLLNFRNFTDYSEPIRHAAFFRAASLGEVKAELDRYRQGTESPEDKSRLAFLEQLNIPEFDDRLKSPAKHERLVPAVKGYVQSYCEDLGANAVPAAIGLLQSEESDRQLKIGSLDCLKFMVIKPFRFTYSRTPEESETEEIVTAWGLWWEREQSRFSELSADREETLKKYMQAMLDAESRSELFRLIDEEFFFEPSDMPFFAALLLDEETDLKSRAISSTLLKLYISRPLQMQIGRDPDEAEIEEVSENWIAHYDSRGDQYNLHLGQKLWRVVADTQYAHMVWRLVTFDFGRSATKSRDPVSTKIWNAFIVSAPLMVMAQLVIYFVAVPLGVICAANRGKKIDQLISIGLFFLYSIPPFVAGMLFLLVFSYGDYFQWFPMERLHSDTADSMGPIEFWLDYLWHSFLPVVCLSLFSLAGMAMYSRSSMLDVLDQDFMRTARAKGLTRSKVILKHGVRNALIPIITLFANFLPALLGGSILIEVIFGIPGMGLLTWDSIEKKDFPTMMAITYVQAIIVLLSVLMTDIMYVFVDPRISFEKQGGTS